MSWCYVDWIKLAEDTDCWQAVVNRVLKLWVSQKTRQEMWQNSWIMIMVHAVSRYIVVCIIQLVTLWPWGWLSLYQKWVPDVFPGGKGGRCIRLTTLPPSCAVVMKSGNLNFLEPSGPLQSCNRTALPLPWPN
jgi:hypothetical protein